ncbi:acyltransferase family protein [Pseudomonas oryzihabitans]|uniref:acyltransferase family protein n=1 Tax=Pseudomonas oryzihabitans TaxID=47885 RepID=UPI001123739F|nr:acyltransferase [Pseudomonas psychrotolerans]QDD91537.1 acyltransferase [Pseudomonas psychrotolerans]
MNTRNLWVDYAKAIGIVLVVYGHVVRGLLNAGILQDAEFHGLVDSVIYTFHMPLFFFLSGLFFYSSFIKRGTGGLLVNKIDTIVYPFLVWSLLQGSVEALMSRYTNGGVSFSEVLTVWEPRQQFWFLYALFLVFCLAMLAYRWAKPLAFFAVFAFGALVYLFQNAGPEDFFFTFTAQNFVFFAFGVWFNNFKQAIEEQAGRVMLGSGLLFIVLEYWFHGLLGLVYTDRGLATLVLALNGIIFVTSTCMVLAQRPLQWVLTLGALSMPIYVMHVLSGSGARIILSKGLHINDGLLHIVLGCAFGILVPVAVAKLLEARNINGLFEAPAWISARRWLRPKAETPRPAV